MFDDLDEDELEIHLPEGALYPNSEIASDLAYLTRVLVEQHGCDHFGGALGGEWGYGTDFENETFRINHFCWCESGDCPQCVGCSCPESAFHYFVDGVEVDFDEWLGVYDREVGRWEPGMSEAEMLEMERRGEEVNKRREQRHDPECPFCLTGGAAAAHGGSAGMSAPNFWHKPSGIKVWWYKWLGRSMTTEGPAEQWRSAFEDTLRSIGADKPAFS